jgi:peptidoglycan hydrolase-like amidase
VKIRIKLSDVRNLEYYGVNSGTVVEVPFEDYVEAVVTSETGDCSKDTNYAMAITVRTFAAGYALSGKEITDTGKLHQVFLASGIGILRAVKQAVQGTKGVVITYNGRPVSGNHSASNGGTTTAAHTRWGGSPKPWSVEKPDPWDTAERKHRRKIGLRNRIGHGVGLSQYGAKYAGRNSVPYQDILAFYFPNTKLTYNYGKGGDVVSEKHRLNTIEAAIAEWANRMVGSGYVWGSTGQTLTRD